MQTFRFRVLLRIEQQYTSSSYSALPSNILHGIKCDVGCLVYLVPYPSSTYPCLLHSLQVFLRRVALQPAVYVVVGWGSFFASCACSMQSNAISSGTQPVFYTRCVVWVCSSFQHVWKMHSGHVQYMWHTICAGAAAAADRMCNGNDQDNDSDDDDSALSAASTSPSLLSLSTHAGVIAHWTPALWRWNNRFVVASPEPPLSSCSF